MSDIKHTPHKGITHKCQGCFSKQRTSEIQFKKLHSSLVTVSTTTYA